MLGSKVCKAFGVPCGFDPFTARRYNGDWVVILPHPSGLCRLWHRPGAVADARRVLGSVGIELPAVAS